MNTNKDGTESLKKIIVETFIDLKRSELSALLKLQDKPHNIKSRRKVGMSQIDLVEDVLARSRKALHISKIITLVQQQHGVLITRDSIVSALAKKVAQGDRFVRTGKNTFGLKKEK